MIKLTLEDGRSIWLNPDKIIIVQQERADESITTIYHEPGDNMGQLPWIDVKEKPEEIADKARGWALGKVHLG